MRSAEHDLRLPDQARAALDGAEVVVHLAANVGGIGFNRRNPAPLVHDNLAMTSNVFEQARQAGVAQAGVGVHGLRLPQVRGRAVPRGRPVGRLPRGDQRAVRAGQEDDARALRRLPAPVRLRLLRADHRQPLRPRRQLRPRGLARDRGHDPQVRGGRRARRRDGDAVGHGHAVARVPVRGRRRPRPAAGRRAAGQLRAGEHGRRQRDADPGAGGDDRGAGGLPGRDGLGRVASPTASRSASWTPSAPAS